MERPVLTRTVSLGSQKDLGLEFIDRIAIAQNKGDGAILYGGCQVDTQVSRRGENGCVHRLRQLGVTLGYA